MTELWEDNRGLVAHVATRYKGYCGKNCDVDDLMQAGYIGLHIAATAYSPNRGASFSTYAVFHLRRSMRQTVGLQGRHDLILDATSLDAPIGHDDNGSTLLDFQAAPGDKYSDERDDLARVVRSAVSRIKNDKARECVETIYWHGRSVIDYAHSEGVIAQTVYERLQNAYWALRKDPAIVSLAIAEGYDIDIYKTQRLGASPEDIAIRKDAHDREQAALYHLLGDLILRMHCTSHPG